MRVVILLLLCAAPVHAQTPTAWPESQRPLANTLSNIGVYGGIGVETWHAWDAGRWKGLGCEGIRLLIVNGTGSVLKQTIHSERPDHSDFHNMPSLHTANGFVWDFKFSLFLGGGVGYLRTAANKHTIPAVLAGAGLGGGTRWATSKLPWCRGL